MPIDQLEKTPHAQAYSDEAARTLSSYAQALQQRVETKSFASTFSGDRINFTIYSKSIGTLYERIRNTFDDRDERFVRLYSIFRILKRRILIDGQRKAFGHSFIRELTRAGYIPNNSIPEEFVGFLDGRFEIITQSIDSWIVEERERLPSGFRDWFIFLFAAEIDESFDESAVLDSTLTALTTEYVCREHPLEKWALPDIEKNVQVYIAVVRSLWRVDARYVSYQLLKIKFPQWQQWTLEVYHEHQQALVDLHHSSFVRYTFPANERLQGMLKTTTAVVRTLREYLKEQTKERLSTLNQSAILKKGLRETLQQAVTKTRRNVIRIVLRSIAYIFLTKTILAILVEIPLDAYFFKVDWTHIGVNIIFPPLLLFVIALLIRLPTLKDTETIMSGIQQLLYDGKVSIEPVKPPVEYGVVSNAVFGLVYVLLYIAIFSGVLTSLSRAQFTPIGASLFLLFLCIVTFFGMRIRARAQSLNVTTQVARAFIAFLMRTLLLPILRAGKFISTNVSRINVFLYFFDFFIEAPFKFFLDLFDQFSSYLKEKEDEINATQG